MQMSRPARASPRNEEENGRSPLSSFPSLRPVPGLASSSSASLFREPDPQPSSTHPRIRGQRESEREREREREALRKAQDSYVLLLLFELFSSFLLLLPSLSFFSYLLLLYTRTYVHVHI